MATSAPGSNLHNEAFEVNVKDFHGSSVVITVSPGWDVSRIKSEISRRTNVNPQDFRIVFAGQTLADTQTLWDIGIQGYSTLHCIRFKGFEVTMDRSINKLDLTQISGKSAPNPPIEAVDSISPANGVPPESGDSAHPRQKHRLYVYCKKPCGRMAPGKLRVRCADCKDSAFVLLGGPGGWEDVLTSRKLHGQCNASNCNGTDAEFYFKCANHPVSDKEECVALHMVRANTIGVDCASCLDVGKLVVVFNCGEQHSLCVPCFEQYCCHQLTNRQFVQKRNIGYTILCPAGCEGSEITESHHFRMLGKDLYDRYQRFGAEEFVLEMGGVLCPRPDCGMGLLPEDPGRRVNCPRENGGCGFSFCRNCKGAYHEGECHQQSQAATQGQQFEVNPEALQRSRWMEATERFIEFSTKACPRCRVPIEKNGGCMHMTCAMASCRFQWCWICEVEWNRGCQSSHWFG